jgi:hypothetical protein
MAQIEGHLRVCLKIDTGFDRMQTVSQPEPLFCEVAYWIMQDEILDTVNVLKLVLGGFVIHEGHRGELLIMLLLTLT